jgi:hypothetical protein
MFTVESKSQLAKLLASENLNVEHKKIQTAYFDLKTRTLACPIWKDMSGELYDLLMGHEVGHALYTPAEGWHDAICENGKNFKSFLNVIEDARIEKKIKRKYPGIKRSFVAAYKDLIDKDFFGIKDKDIQSLPFIDKVNLETKTESSLNIQFDDEQQVLMDEVFACETWEEVVTVSQKIFDYSKNEQKSMLEDFFSVPEYELSEFDDGLDYEETDIESDDEESDIESDAEESESKESDGESDSEETSDNPDTNFDKTESENFDPVCKTDEIFRRSEVNLLDEKSKEYVYAEIPKFDLDDIVTPVEVVHHYLSDKFSLYYTEEQLNSQYKEFRKKNDKYISLLVKEFEMKKSAKAYLKSKTSDTGDIDINKIFKYQIDDNIFKKITSQPKGKSHGLLLLLDRSGSMYGNMKSSIEQILILSLFCKKVNIPFIVYGFGDCSLSRHADFPGLNYKPTFQESENSLALGDVYLREYLNSSMKKSQFNECVRNLVLLSELYDIDYGRYRLPINESLSSTPLIEAMVVMKSIAKKFKKDYNLDIINTAIVHDGDADSIRSVKKYDSEYEKFYTQTFDIQSNNVFIVDKNENQQIKVVSDTTMGNYYYDNGLKNSIFELYTKVTGSKIFGFFIVGKGVTAKKNITSKYRKLGNLPIITTTKSYDLFRDTYESPEMDKLMAKFKEDKFLQSFNYGYESFYLIPGGKDLSVGDEELVIDGNITKGKLKTAFMKLGKKKQTNRVLVSKFISGIA